MSIATTARDSPRLIEGRIVRKIVTSVGRLRRQSACALAFPRVVELGDRAGSLCANISSLSSPFPERTRPPCSHPRTRDRKEIKNALRGTSVSLLGIQMLPLLRYQLYPWRVLPPSRWERFLINFWMDVRGELANLSEWNMGWRNSNDEGS